MDPLTYSDYLALDQILAAQLPRSEEHDEHLFIVVHQVYELWFKQLIHEIRHLQEHLGSGRGARALHSLRRILTILKVAVAQVDVLETMTPREFTSFRSRLDSSSGFQSAQFRVIEALLGRRDEALVRPFLDQPAAADAIRSAMAGPSVWESFEAYLRVSGWEEAPSEELLVAIYAADSTEAQVCERLVDLDEGLQEWRYRHVKMVERTIGDKSGTGGSSGAEYLRATLFRPVFPLLWSVRRRL